MKKFLKGSLSLLLAVTIVLSAAYIGLSEVDFAISASAASGNLSANVQWLLDNDGVLTISGNGPMVDYSYGSGALPYQANLVKKVVIADGVTSVGERAFKDCKVLKSVEIADSVTSIGYGAFYGCSSLDDVKIGDGVTSIGGDAFYGTEIFNEEENYWTNGVLYIGKYLIAVKTNVSNVVTKPGTKVIADKAFAYSGASSVALNEGIVNIPSYAFYGCSNLVSVKIPETVVTIGAYAFENCTRLQSVYWNAKLVQDFTADSNIFRCAGTEGSGINFYFGEKVLKVPAYLCYSEKKTQRANVANVEIVGDTTIIGAYAFYKCENLSTVTLGNKIEFIEDNAFAGCTGITRINFLGKISEWKQVHKGANNDVLDYYDRYAEDEDGNVVKVADVVYFQKPDTPAVLALNPLVGGIQVVWAPVEDARMYNVYRRAAGSNAWIYIGTTRDGNTTLVDNTVVSGQYYCYSVRAYITHSQYSDYAPSLTKYRKFVDAPKVTSLDNEVNGIRVTWDAVNTNGPVEYRVYRRGVASSNYTYLGTTTNLTFLDTGVKNSYATYYRYVVKAVAGKDGVGYYSAADTNYGLYTYRLAAPAIKNVDSTKTGISLKWGAVDGSTGYYVYRKTAGSTWSRVAYVSGVNNTTYVDKTAKQSVTYTYAVRSVYVRYYSAMSSTVSCTDRY